MGHCTAALEDNLLRLTDKHEVNAQEELRVAGAERYVLEELDYPVDLAAGLLQNLHRRAFGQLYEWAGQWRRGVPNERAYLSPPAHQVPLLLYEFVDELTGLLIAAGGVKLL
ncbi:hypothetical protein K3G63_22315 [Hymenobacter sp. HSC-4F20]|uniref:hypothetical protein n=1 Tax=Hymenobacter sp. HSC-4F20 TaxID=2864135 RepID=UPI001C72ED06|nr:hypothetical protein [Hymenobacter sp. HSC-4F20]MBX0293196.1 hypothetical protein [Hymenobacter sp. HSC-4F20]